jgi:hypothetical protein
LEHFTANIAALSVTLNPNDMSEIEKAYDFDPGFPHTLLSGTNFRDGRRAVPHGPSDVWLTGVLGTFDRDQPEQPIGVVQRK